MDGSGHSISLLNLMESDCKIFLRFFFFQNVFGKLMQLFSQDLFCETNYFCCFGLYCHCFIDASLQAAKFYPILFLLWMQTCSVLILNTQWLPKMLHGTFFTDMFYPYFKGEATGNCFLPLLDRSLFISDLIAILFWSIITIIGFLVNIIKMTVLLLKAKFNWKFGT